MVEVVIAHWVDVCAAVVVLIALFCPYYFALFGEE